jgi:hypothetical protein
VYFDTKDQLLITYSAFIKYWENNGAMHQLFIHIKKACDSVRREVLYNVLIEFGIPMKLVSLIKMCLNKTYSKVHICKSLSDAFPIQNDLHFNFA